MWVCICHVLQVLSPSAHPSCWDEKPKDFTCGGNTIILDGGRSLLISTLDKTPERWCLCLLTGGLLIWHLAGWRSASISQSIVHLIQCSAALVKMQGKTLSGWFDGLFALLFVLFAVKSCSCLTISLGYCSSVEEIFGLKHLLSWKKLRKRESIFKNVVPVISPCSDLYLVSNRSLLCFWLTSVGPF